MEHRPSQSRPAVRGAGTGCARRVPRERARTRPLTIPNGVPGPRRLCMARTWLVAVVSIVILAGLCGAPVLLKHRAPPAPPNPIAVDCNAQVVPGDGHGVRGRSVRRGGTVDGGRVPALPRGAAPARLGLCRRAPQGGLLRRQPAGCTLSHGYAPARVMLVQRLTEVRSGWEGSGRYRT